MLKVFLTVMMWALSSGCGLTGIQGPPHQEKKAAGLPTIRLTNEQPKGALLFDSDLIPSDSDVLEISVEKVVNPAQTPTSIFVYISGEADKAEADSKRIALGSFSLYPADKPGKFLLPAPSRELIKGKMVKIEFELKRTDESKAWTDIEVDVRPPIWRSERNDKRS